MATTVASNLHYCAHGSGFQVGDSVVKDLKNTRRSWEPAGPSFTCLVPKQQELLRRGSWRRNGPDNSPGLRRPGTVVLASIGRDVPGDADSDNEDSSNNSVDAELFRQRIENMVGNDAKDARFEGKDLAQLIRNKYGRSYDVRLIKKDFFGRQLLAMNIMWKYREQRSFPLTEEEYLLHLDYIAQSLRGWGAVGVVRDSLEKTRERPRTGKAVSIFINPDESGERSREWIKT